jgi:hypothetical protein
LIDTGKNLSESGIILMKTGRKEEATTVTGIKKGKNKPDTEWAEAYKKCHLNAETVKMAKELGMNPKSLIKNIPGKRELWKAPVKVWIQEMYEKHKTRSKRKKEEAKESGAVKP